MRASIFTLWRILLFTSVLSCESEFEKDNEDIDDDTPIDINFATPDWATSSHSKNTSPDYATVFPQDQVNTVEIVMRASDWQFIQADMKTKFSSTFGQGGGSPGGIGGTSIFGTAEPDYVATSVKFNGIEWYKVGFRLKGNSSLFASWRAGIYKLPFRLNFDKFEDTYPQIKNQRFFGFKELSMSPGANDNSLIREKVGSDIFRMAGIPTSQTAFYKVYINFGDGLKYCGIYTMVEVVDDTMITDQFGEKNGNIYKPESTFQSFKVSEFEKKNNEEANDYSDIQSTITTLNSSLRTSNPAQWRALLETNFNVDHFLKWLAINTTMLNWDTYGTMAHNYYLYNQPEQGLTWIPWDNNESMMSRGRTVLSISLSNASSGWPLIRNLIDDPVYQDNYKNYVREFTTNVFTPEKMNTLFEYNFNMIAPFVIGPLETEQPKYTHLLSTSAFINSVTSLQQHVVSQRQQVERYLK
ncbi:MAG: CotH kinase family protein [Cyclobacteriaceae bacterium]|nr:CotH kinase family protein [Cyclobacteriaceae bacterium]